MYLFKTVQVFGTMDFFKLNTHHAYYFYTGLDKQSKQSE